MKRFKWLFPLLMLMATFFIASTVSAQCDCKVRPVDQVLAMDISVPAGTLMIIASDQRKTSATLSEWPIDAFKQPIEPWLTKSAIQSLVPVLVSGQPEPPYSISAHSKTTYKTFIASLGEEKPRGFVSGLNPMTC